jgi:hypothetical protein
MPSDARHFGNRDSPAEAQTLEAALTTGTTEVDLANLVEGVVFRWKGSF